MQNIQKVLTTLAGAIIPKNYMSKVHSAIENQNAKLDQRTQPKPAGTAEENTPLVQVEIDPKGEENQNQTANTGNVDQKEIN